jgi:DNA-binding CsgD family transcriptional regulator
MPRKDGRRELMVLVFPLRPQAPWTRHYRPAAMVFVSDPERGTALRNEHLREQFNLTETEASLALHIVAGRGLQAAADRMNIGVSTARTHLAHVFAKTKTHRQAELVRLILQSDGGLDA